MKFPFTLARYWHNTLIYNYFFSAFLMTLLFVAGGLGPLVKTHEIALGVLKRAYPTHALADFHHRHAHFSAGGHDFLQGSVYG